MPAAATGSIAALRSGYRRPASGVDVDTPARLSDPATALP